MIQKKLNSPFTSSAGRLFDAISSLLCLRHEISHESQAAMELEAVASNSQFDSDSDAEYEVEPGYNIEPYSFSIIEEKNRNIQNHDQYFEIDFMPCIHEVVDDLLNKTYNPDKIANTIISRKFHQTMIKAFADTAQKVATKNGINKTVLSGGVFNNNLILTGMIKELKRNNLTVFTHTRVPTGDGGICLGQVVSAAARMVSRQQNSVG